MKSIVFMFLCLIKIICSNDHDLMSIANENFDSSALKLVNCIRKLIPGTEPLHTFDDDDELLKKTKRKIWDFKNSIANKNWNLNERANQFFQFFKRYISLTEDSKVNINNVKICLEQFYVDICDGFPEETGETSQQSTNEKQ
ncbi:uncharacterized protein LOC126905620 [Daktulosphaira vitifoliae]|uniref:uncharacterized protein LOC126905620 n=1 Tax=Daktulosphaira vitifoliae TaxID=58002 RepID=UPI0021A9A347|nr:uncharacterized protein LOC126905620 [Daktulosphaira vitifoliae]